MKILHVDKFFDLHGGAEIYMHRVMKMQQDAGHEVHAFSTRSEKNLPSKDSSHFVTRYDLSKSHGWKTDLQIAKNYLWNVEAKREMERLLDEVKPDIIHLHNLYHHLSTSVLSPILKRRIPCVQTLHDYKLSGCANYMMFTEGAPCERCKGGNYLNVLKHHCLSASPLPNLLAAMEMGITKGRHIYERAVRLFLCPSHFMKEKMEDWGEPPSKLRYIANPTDYAEEAVPRGGGYLLFAGRLSVEKGLASFIEAAAKVPELPIKIAGRGSGRLGVEEQVRSLVRSLGAPHIEFLGFQLPADLAVTRRRAEALICPSIWYENASLTILEAMGDGLPVLGTRIGGIPEMIEDGVNGFLAKPGDVDDWLRVLRRFQALTVEARAKMGEEGRRKVRERFLWTTHMERLMSLYAEASV